MFATVAIRGFVVPGCNDDIKCSMTAAHTVNAGDSFPHNTRETAQRHADKNNKQFAKYGGDCWTVKEGKS